MKEEMIFKKQLKKLIGEDSVRAAAKKCAISEETFQHYLKDDSENEPTVSKLQKIANAYNVRLGWLAAGEEPKDLNCPIDNQKNSQTNVACIEEERRKIYKRNSDFLNDAMRELAKRLMVMHEKDLDGFWKVTTLVNECMDKITEKDQKTITGES